MNKPGSGSGATRRGFLTRAAGLAAAAGTVLATDVGTQVLAKTEKQGPTHADPHIEPFWGKNQGGIATPAQGHTYFAALDLTTTKRDEVIALLKAWTSAAARMA